jgi:small subunit ribosomal protein S4
MARYTGSKVKLMRKFGQDLGLKTNTQKVARRLNVRPGQHGQRMRRKVSDYGVQLMEKQKVKAIYGLQERQFRNYYQQSNINFLELIESRLDNVVYRLGFAPTRTMARQLVTHGHIMVDDKRVSIPSFLTKAGQTISLRPNTIKIPDVAKLLIDKDFKTPLWLTRKASVGKIKRLPLRSDITEDIHDQLIIEFYSR